MSVFTSRVTKIVAIPHDDGQSVTIRKLSPKHLGKAATAQQVQAMEDLRAIGGPAFLKELQALTDSPAKTATTADPLLLFDRLELIARGVTAWTYADPLTKESFEDLDEETAEFVAREVLRLAKPDLFLTVPEAEVEQKNG